MTSAPGTFSAQSAAAVFAGLYTPPISTTTIGMPVHPGQKFGRLTVLYQLRIGRMAHAVVECECGQARKVLQASLRNGTTKSCGCLRREKFIERTVTHGLTGSPTYGSWRAMVSRCTNPNDKSYALYGARGVRVCDRWRVFASFLADMGERPEGMTLDRFPNKDGDYEPGNVRWATAEQQSRNRSSVLTVEHDGRRMTVAEWAREVGIPPNRVYARLNQYGWEVARALELPGARFVEEPAA